MPARRISIDAIRAELAWVTEMPDPDKCGCRNLRCCEETGHKPGACSGAVATKFWTFRWEYYCAPCREYQGCGSERATTLVDRLFGGVLMCRIVFYFIFIGTR